MRFCGHLLLQKLVRHFWCLFMFRKSRKTHGFLTTTAELSASMYFYLIKSLIFTDLRPLSLNHGSSVIVLFLLYTPICSISIIAIVDNYYIYNKYVFFLNTIIIKESDYICIMIDMYNMLLIIWHLFGLIKLLWLIHNDMNCYWSVLWVFHCLTAYPCVVCVNLFHVMLLK